MRTRWSWRSWCALGGLLFLWLFDYSWEVKAQSMETTTPISRANALRKFDEQLHVYLNLTDFNLRDTVALAVLYFHREDQWRQGGEKESLQYTEMAVSLMLPNNDLFSLSSSDYEVYMALTVHKIRLYSLRGRHEDAIREAKDVVAAHEQMLNTSTATTSSQEQRARLHHALGDALLIYGQAEEAVPWLTSAVSLSPCLHHGYFQLAKALQHTPSSSQTVNRRAASQQLMDTIENVLAGLSVDEETGTMVFVPDDDTLSQTRQCTFADEVSYLEALIRYANLGTWTYSTTASAHVVRSALFWSLFHCAETVQDFDLAWFYLQQGRGIERQRLQLLQDEQQRQQRQTQESIAEEEGGAQVSAAPIITYNRTQSIQNAMQVTKSFQPSFWSTNSSPRPLSSSERNDHRKDSKNGRNGHSKLESEYTPAEQLPGSSSRVPVFIVGFFRSGSTLLESLLGSHPSVHTLGERSPFAQHARTSLTPFLQRYHPLYNDNGVRKTPEERRQRQFEVQLLWQAQRIEEHMRALCREQATTISAQQRCNRTLPSPPFSSSSSTTSSATSSSSSSSYTSISSPKSGSMTTDALDDTNDDDADDFSLRIVDKMLLNYRAVGLIHLLFPHAIILHTFRDPLDTLVSCLRHRFSDDQSSYTLEIRDLVAEYVAYLMVMAHFRRVLPRRLYTMYEEEGEAQPGHRRLKEVRVVRQALLDVHYERLVSSPHLLLRSLFHYLHLPPLNASAVEDFFVSDRQRTRSIRTASYYQVRQPVSTQGVGQWRVYAKHLHYSLHVELDEALRRLREKKHLLPAWDPTYKRSQRQATPSAKRGNTSSAASASTTTTAALQTKVDMDSGTKEILDDEDMQKKLMNWALDPSFDYTGHLRALRRAVQSEGLLLSSYNPNTNNNEH